MSAPPHQQRLVGNFPTNGQPSYYPPMQMMPVYRGPPPMQQQPCTSASNGVYPPAPQQSQAPARQNVRVASAQERKSSSVVRVFTSEMANEGAIAVGNGTFSRIIHYHEAKIQNDNQSLNKSQPSPAPRAKRPEPSPKSVPPRTPQTPGGGPLSARGPGTPGDPSVMPCKGSASLPSTPAAVGPPYANMPLSADSVPEVDSHNPLQQMERMTQETLSYEPPLPKVARMGSPRESIQSPRDHMLNRMKPPVAGHDDLTPEQLQHRQSKLRQIEQMKEIYLRPDEAPRLQRMPGPDQAEMMFHMQSQQMMMQQMCPRPMMPDNQQDAQIKWEREVQEHYMKHRAGAPIMTPQGMPLVQERPPRQPKPTMMVPPQPNRNMPPMAFMNEEAMRQRMIPPNMQMFSQQNPGFVPPGYGGMSPQDMAFEPMFMAQQDCGPGPPPAQKRTYDQMEYQNQMIRQQQQMIQANQPMPGLPPPPGGRPAPLRGNGAEAPIVNNTYVNANVQIGQVNYQNVPVGHPSLNLQQQMTAQSHMAARAAGPIPMRAPDMMPNPNEGQPQGDVMSHFLGLAQPLTDLDNKVPSAKMQYFPSGPQNTRQDEYEYRSAVLAAQSLKSGSSGVCMEQKLMIQQDQMRLQQDQQLQFGPPK